MPDLPDFPKQKRDLVVLALRVGWMEFDVCDAVGISRETLAAWRDGDEQFADEVQRAVDAAIQDEVMAGSVVRNAAKNDSNAAAKLLRDRAQSRELARIKELTTY